MSKEILNVVDSVSNEKGVDKEIIFNAIEIALATATRKNIQKKLMFESQLIELLETIRHTEGGPFYQMMIQNLYLQTLKFFTPMQQNSMTKLK